MTRLSFFGAAGEVTGSCTLVETAGTRFLVDCGMFQGNRDAPEKNRAPFPFDPHHIDFVILSHAHIDHSGLLPKLCREGFQGPIFMTAATRDLIEIMLADSAKIQEAEAERARESGDPDSPDAVPLYTLRDAAAVAGHIHIVAYDEVQKADHAVRFRFRDAGHILGSAITEIWLEGDGKALKLVFSGDLGQPDRAILRDPEKIPDADVLLVESTYGNRLHKCLESTLKEFERVVTETIARRGNVVIPAFAVGRTQEILYHFQQLTREGRFRDLHVFVDSPLATAATEITARHFRLYDEEAKRLARWNTTNDAPLQIRFTASVQDSRALNDIRSGAIIIAGSGMCTAGRVLHHLRHNLPRPECAVLITGYQAAGTLGRQLVDGAAEIRIHGRPVPVRAGIHTLGGFSAHADQAALIDWLAGFAAPPQKTFIVHGETATAEVFAGEITRQLGWQAEIPEPGSKVTIER